MNEPCQHFVQALIERGANLHAEDSKLGTHPLHMAAFNGQTETVQALIELAELLLHAENYFQRMMKDSAGTDDRARRQAICGRL